MAEKNIFLEEIDELQKKKDERLEELKEFETKKTPNIFSLAVDLIKPFTARNLAFDAASYESGLLNPETLETIFSQREGLEKFGLNRETFEALGGISGLAAGTRALTYRALPYVPSVPGKLLSLILYDALGATAGAQAFDIIQKNITGDEISLWEQLEVLPDDIKRSLTWATIGPMAEASIQMFRALLSTGVKNNPALKEAFEKSRQYLGDKLAFSIGDLDKTSGVGRFINISRMGFAQIPLLGAKLKGVTAERTTKLFDLLGDFSNKMGKNLEEDELAKRIFEQSNKAYTSFKKAMGRISDEIVQAEKSVPNKGRVIPTNSMRDFLQKYVDEFEDAYGVVTKTNDPSYNDYYNFAKRFLAKYPPNSRISYSSWKKAMKELEASVKNSKGKTGAPSKNELGQSFDEMRALLDNAGADDFLAKFSKEDQQIVKKYIQQIKDFRQIYTTAREPFERVVAGEIEKVDDIFTALSGRFKGESKKYIDELVAPLLRRMSPSAVDDLLRITGGDRKLMGQIVRTWFDDAIVSATQFEKGKPEGLLNTEVLLKKLGLDGAGNKIKGKAFKQLVGIMNEGLSESQKLPEGFVMDLIDMIKTQQGIDIPSTGAYLRRSFAIGGQGGFNAILNHPLARLFTSVFGAPIGVVGSLIGVRGLSEFLVDPDTLKYAIKGFDSTLPRIQRKANWIQFLRAATGEIDQRIKDAALNTELAALDPSLDPNYGEEAKSKIENLLENLKLFDNEGAEQNNVLDQIIDEVDSLKRGEGSNIFLDEIENLEQAPKEITPDQFPQGGGSVIFSEPQVQRGDTGVDVVPPIAVPNALAAGQQGAAFNLGPTNPQTLASLESLGMPLFNAADGGIVDLYESKKFKKPQVVA